ncbi:unnamed protein product [Lactuca saligna]|uniref:Protein kinase domain-containing protein n=1 Tax=Lactuca saligna TaxID=75948 RepID=A0AA36ENC8_LACSI|nr:unnamed protein product [Lactuca saligna]
MERRHKIMLIVALSSSFTLFVTLALIYLCRSKRCSKDESWDKESNIEVDDMEMKGDLLRFEGGEDLNCFDILDAPGEVIGKSSYGTLYRANLVRNDSVVVLRFLRPTCTEKVQDVMHVVQLLGSIRHPNLVPLCGFYLGPRGEKLLVHPFYRRGNLAQFIRDGNGESLKWSVIYRISIGIAGGLHYLHTGLQNPVIHGNLKSKNILLGRNQQPIVSDFGLHLLLNPSATQEMLEDAALEGYNQPKSIKANATNLETDIFNFGVILFELLTGKEPTSNEKANPDRDFNSNAILDHRILGFSNPENRVDEEHILKLTEIAIACCSSSPSLRPNIKQICKKLREIGS